MFYVIVVYPEFGGGGSQKLFGQFPYDYTRTTFQKGACPIYPGLWIILYKFGIWEYIPRIFGNLENISRIFQNSEK